MNVLIIGYGYCGFYLAQYLKSKYARVTTLSRHLSRALQIDGVIHLRGDLTTTLHMEEHYTHIFYMAPPDSHGTNDQRVSLFLSHNNLKTDHFIYFGSSAVYGDHGGEWVNELSDCHLCFDTQKRRLDAETQIKKWSRQHSVSCVILRVAGIYGPNRLPIESVKQKDPIITPTEASWSNLIYVQDLIELAYLLSTKGIGSETFNVADGYPRKMGALKQMVASLFDLPDLPYVSKKKSLEGATGLKQMFLSSSKKLNVSKLKACLPYYTMTKLEAGVRMAIHLSHSAV